jgi:hypothetical protein
MVGLQRHCLLTDCVHPYSGLRGLGLCWPDGHQAFRAPDFQLFGTQHVLCDKTSTPPFSSIFVLFFLTKTF